MEKEMSLVRMPNCVVAHSLHQPHTHKHTHTRIDAHSARFLAYTPGLGDRGAREGKRER